MADRGGFRVRRVGKALPPFGDDFVNIEALSGLVLLAAAISALVWANVATASYFDVWDHHLDLSFGPFDLDLSRAHWVTDGLMTLFFFVVGVEIKREVVRGELRDPRTAALPVVAAVGGMVVPALFYVAVNVGEPTVKGWAIPMATDIAFAVGVLAILGSRVPRSLKLFLLTLAIVDDIGAILVIAVFYSKGIEFGWLAAAAAIIGSILLMQRMGIPSPLAYVLPAFALWLFVDQSGVHATIAGVILGLLTPARPFGGRQVIEQLEHRLHPWSSFVVVPLFALANAGVVVDGDTIRRTLESPIAIGVVLGLVVGKPLGITLATAAGVRLRLGRLPEGMSWRDVVGLGAVAGIGFTVALFVDDLSFRGVNFDEAVLGILIGSLVSGLVGAAILGTSPARRTGVPAPRDDLGAARPARTVAFVSELIDRSRIAAALGEDPTFTSDPNDAAGAETVVVDLVRFGPLLAEIRAVTSGRIVAYGPHVDQELLAEAEYAGADVVMARSRFFRDPAAAVADA